MVRQLYDATCMCLASAAMVLLGSFYVVGVRWLTCTSCDCSKSIMKQRFLKFVLCPSALGQICWYTILDKIKCTKCNLSNATNINVALCPPLPPICNVVFKFQQYRGRWHSFCYRAMWSYLFTIFATLQMGEGGGVVRYKCYVFLGSICKFMLICSGKCSVLVLCTFILSGIVYGKRQVNT